MVYFSCDKCSEALKKNQVEKHSFKCRFATYSCLDCHKSFTVDSYASHVKCISENKKYGGTNYVEKENKGEQKQNRWVEQVERAISCVRDQNLKRLLEQIRGFTNIPRKEAKFINFLRNSVRIHDRDLCSKAWKCIAEEAEKIRNEENSINDANGDQTVKEAITNEDSKVNSAEANEKREAEQKQRVDEKKQQNRANGRVIENASVVIEKPFKWKRAIKRKLKEAENGQIRLKKLRKLVIKEYLGVSSDNSDDHEHLKALFNAKLQSSGLRIDGKMVYSSSHA